MINRTNNFQHSTSKIILLICFLFLSLIGFSQWVTDSSINTSISSAINDQKNLSIVSDLKKGAFVSWNDYRASTSSSDIYLQHIDSNGNKLWTSDGLGVCLDPADQASPTLIPDGTGGLIVAWEDSRNGNIDIFAQKVDSSGNIKWTTNGISVVLKANYQKNLKLVSDGAGGAIITWQDSVNGLADIYAQRINSSGNVLWTTGGVVICNAAGNQSNPKIQADLSGGAIMAWQDKRNGNDYDIYTQKINSSGITQWTGNGVAIAKLAGTQSNCKIRGDGSGGAIIAWPDKRNAVDYDIFIQRIDSLGMIQWTANGVKVCGAAGSQSSLDMASDGIAGVIITWKDGRTLSSGNLDIYVQKINLSGLTEWTANGIIVSNSANNQLNPNVIGDGNGGAIITWQDSVNGTFDVYTQRISSGGLPLWSSNGIIVSNAADHQTGAKNVTDGEGGSIYVWEDARNGSDKNIFAHHYYSNGSAIPLVLSNHGKSYLNKNCFPNPASQNVFFPVGDFNFMNAQNYKLIITDMLGRQVEVSPVPYSGGLAINNLCLPEGTYFFKINFEYSHIFSGRFVVENNF